MRLTVSLEKGIIVVVPRSMSQRSMKKIIPAFIKDKQQWLRDTIKKLYSGRSHRAASECSLPQAITLTALKQCFFVTYQPASAADNGVRKALTLYYPEHRQLEISGDLSDKKQVFALFERFFKDYAYEHLQQRLVHLSRKFNLPYNRLTVRAQKTRWGSCSAKKNINLNYRLLFIEADLVDYIVLHELVHTVHMNHSQAFWDYFETLLPGARLTDRRVNQIAKSLPCWIFYKE